MRRLSLLAVVALLVLSGCVAPMASPGPGVGPEDDLGTVAGYAHDDDLEIDDPDGLSREELEAVTYRAMARIEVLRGLEFEEEVDVEVITREEFREESWYDDPADRFTNELWRGTFVVDGETDVNEELSALYRESVRGYYADGEIVIVTDDPEASQVDRATLVHELVHALQDQHVGLAREGTTLDERRAELGVTEGEAEYLTRLYDDRCDAEWGCLEDAGAEVEPPAEREFNVGLFLSVFVPYSEGPTFVEQLRTEGNWAAVDAAYDERPASTSQLVHPERYPDVEPIDVELEDRSSSEWEPMTDDGERRTETIGEATLFATLWANGVIDRPLTEGVEEYATYNYSHPVTDGWAGDTFLAYENSGETGHVWELAWEHPEDADAFEDAYVDLLEANGAEAVEDGVYRIDDGEAFAGAYRVDRDGERVRIVGAPSTGDLEAIGGPATASPSVELEATSPTASAAEPATHGPAEANVVFE